MEPFIKAKFRWGSEDQDYPNKMSAVVGIEGAAIAKWIRMRLLSAKHTIYALSFIVKFVLYLSCEMNKIKQKEAGFGPF